MQPKQSETRTNYSSINIVTMCGIKRSEITEVIYEDVMMMTETVGMERVERVEMMVDIYDSVDTVRHHDLRTNTERHPPLQHTGSVSVKNRKHRAVEVCLCLLCVLLLTAVMVLCVYFTTERNQLLTHINNLTEERHQIITKNEQILNHINNLTEEREQMKNKIDELQRGLYEQDQRADNFIWIYYNFSFYYFSSEWMSWSDSRRDCQERGADLVIIHSQEEQEFLKKVVGNNAFWFGLTKTQGVWEWIDGTTITNGYRSSQDMQYEYTYSNFCAVMTSSGWKDWQCDSLTQWICKRTFFM